MSCFFRNLSPLNLSRSLSVTVPKAVSSRRWLLRASREILNILPMCGLGQIGSGFSVAFSNFSSRVWPKWCYKEWHTTCSTLVLLSNATTNTYDQEISCKSLNELQSYISHRSNVQTKINLGLLRGEYQFWSISALWLNQKSQIHRIFEVTTRFYVNGTGADHGSTCTD